MNEKDLINKIGEETEQNINEMSEVSVQSETITGQEMPADEVRDNANQESEAPVMMETSDASETKKDAATAFAFAEEAVTSSDAEKKHKKGKKRTAMAFVASVLAAALIGGLAGGAMVSHQLNVALDQNSANYEAIKNGAVQQVSIDLSDDVYYAQAVAEKAQKVVVGITTTVTQNTFWGQQTAQGMGSGIIVSSDGYILTNSHVIEDGSAETATVSFIDGSTAPAEIKWYDTSLDLAIVKVDKTGLPAAELGDSDSLHIGEPVVAIGNPMTLDFERTVTDGIVSGLNRSITFDNGTTIKPLIQTNASINPGNSGGPLFNAKGEVIGINTAKMQSAEGLGFAIPINTAKPLLEQMMQSGTVSSVYVGITGMDVANYEKALNLQLSAESGVIVIEATEDTPAAKAGLKMGDIITSIDGNKVEGMDDLKRLLYNYKAGDTAEMKILRDNEEMTLNITFQQKSADQQ